MFKARLLEGWTSFLKKLALVVEFWGTKEHAASALAESFDKAKLLSDFIGMIVRLAFAFAATAFFFRRAHEVPGYNGWMLAVCASLSAGLTIVFSYRIINLIFAYEARSVHAWKSTWAKLFALSVGLLITVCVWQGITDVIRVLGSSLSTAK